MKIDGRPITDLVYQMLTIDGHIAPHLPRASSVALANASPVFGAGVTVDPRRIVVRLDVRPSSLTDRRAVLDTFAYRLGGGVLHEITFDDAPDRVFLAVAEPPQVTFTPAGIAYGLPRCEVVLAFAVAPSGAHDREPRVYALTTTPTPLPLGTDAVAPRVWLFGASTPVVDPEVVLTNHAGVEVARLAFAVSLAVDDFLAFDSGTQRIDRYVAGVRQSGAASGLAALVDGAFPILSIEDASPELGAWPRLALTASSGAPTGAVAFSRRW